MSTDVPPWPPALLDVLRPIQHLLDDSSVTDILLDGTERILVDRVGAQREVLPSAFQRAATLTALVRFLGELDGAEETREHVTVRLPDGSRVHAIAHSCAHRGNGPWIAIRRFRRLHLDADALIKNGAIPAEEMARLQHALVAERRNVIVSGETGSGKTTFAEVLLRSLPPSERLLIMQDIEEIVPPTKEHCWGSFRPGPNGYTGLLASLLRMQPDRIALGEVRGPEAWVLLEALTTGHSGGVTTLHARSPAGALRRLESMSLLHPHAPDGRAIRARIAEAADVIVQVARHHHAGEISRSVVHIAVVDSVTPTGDIRLQTLWKRKRGT